MLTVMIIHIPEGVIRFISDTAYRDHGGSSFGNWGKFKTSPCLYDTKTYCISLCGVKLWNRLSDELNLCPIMTQFRKQNREEAGL